MTKACRINGGRQWQQSDSLPTRERRLITLRGEPAKTIIRASKKANADLIVLGTHGKTGTDAFWSGSVTPGVCAGCDVPILLVPVKQ